MGNHALITLLAWPYHGRERLPRGLAAGLDAAGLLPTTDMPHRHPHDCRRPVVLAGDIESGPILHGVPAHHATACDVLIAGLAAAGLHVYVGRGPAGGYCAIWDYHPPGTGKHAARHRCCDRDRPPNRTERSCDPDDATECQLNPWARLMLPRPPASPRWCCSPPTDALATGGTHARATWRRWIAARPTALREASQRSLATYTTGGPLLVCLIAIVVLALMLAIAGRLVRLAVRIALLIALIALLVSYSAHAAGRHERASPPTPAIRRRSR